MDKILVIEDEEDISELVEFNLRKEGYEVLVAKDGLAGLKAAQSFLPDAIVLDLMLPELDGIQVFKRLRQDTRTNKIPVIMVTARAQQADKIGGLELGADDYLTKPFSPRELVLRVTNLLKRRRVTHASELVFEDFRLDLKNQVLQVQGHPVVVTGTELKLMTAFLENPCHTLHRADLLREVWGYHDDSNTRTLDTHLKRLREKLGPLASRIQTVRGHGYRLCSSEETPQDP